MAETRTITTRSGKTVESDLTNTEALALMLATNPTYRFALELAEKSDRLSDEQWRWVHVLAIEGLARRDAPKPATITVGDLSGLVSMLTGAKASLKYPKIRLSVGGVNIVLGLRRDGSITIADADVWDWNDRFGKDMRRWYGTVSTAGEFSPSRLGAKIDGLADLLSAMSRDPEGTAAAYGKLTGNCCFCGRNLEDEKSTGVGYGPVCAKRYGLPWGAKEKVA